MKNIQIVIGSNAKNSLQKKFANAIKQSYGDKANYEILEIDKLPMYNYEIENEYLKELEEFQDKISKADGVIFLAAEYNGSIHAVLKNALDWLSRGKQELKGKPVFVTGATPSVLGTVRAQNHTKYILGTQYISASVLPGVQVLFSNAYSKMDENGIKDEETKKFLGDALDQFNNWIDKLK